jgi:hypothetical protein
MSNAVLTHFDNNTPVWTGIHIVAEGVGKLRNTLADITVTATRQSENNPMEYLYRNKVMILILFPICISSCKHIPKTEIKVEQENIYELLITFSHKKIGGVYCTESIMIHLNAIEFDKNRVLRQRYSDFHRMGRNILEEGWQKHSYSLLSPHRNWILKKDFDKFQYWDYNIDISKGAGAIFSSGFYKEEYAWTIDSIPPAELMERTVVLEDPDYEIHINDSIYIPHACRLLTKTHYEDEVFKHIFVYDRDRQMTVNAEFRDVHTDEIILKYELIKVVTITRNDFYKFWTEPETCWEDMEIVLPDPEVYMDDIQNGNYVLDFIY